ncbi:MAG: flagellar filament capping protein FliD [Hydrogenovibrio sp.]|uniref:flagellar filament capping protein FliD n=1 Tax=Hydrogenovibrio sp. TaxID=2065821 RepID=UPI0028705B35|nr:flagellar filament capping protein FliD [Hydrogenovibrio sp.]MDR9499590.1 flagellar filament capping protein FliD [Hydrogenovibrio sp.]
MANDIGTTLLTGLTNSSFNLGEMSKTLAEAEVAGKRAFIEQKQDKTSTELDAIKYLKTNLTAFQSYMTDLSDPSFFNQKTATSSNEDVVSVSATSSAAPATYNVETKQLAQVHTEVSGQQYASPSSTLNDGSIEFDMGGAVETIGINGTNGTNTLEGLRDYINNGDYNVSASIVNNGGNYQMMFTSKTQGAAGQFTVSGDTALTSAMTTSSTGQDAQIELNGMLLNSSTNTFDEVIEGVTLQAKSAVPGSINTISIGQDTTGIKESVSEFVNVFNQLHTITDELGSYDKSDLSEAELESEEYEFYGDLAGSSMLRTVESQLRSSLSGALEELGSDFNSLAQVGISFDREGKLQLDSAQLDSAISSNLQGVSNIFAEGGSSDDALVSNITGSDKTQTGNYELNITTVASRAMHTGGAATTEPDNTISLANDATFDISVDGSTASQVTIAAGNYTFDALASTLSSQINGLDSVTSSGASVSVTHDGSAFSITSDRYGMNSSLEITGMTNFANSGLTNTAGVVSGDNLDGTLTSEDGTTISIFGTPEDGRKVEVSDYATKNGEYVDMRGLSFEVAGMPAGGAATITYSQGFASKLDQTIENFFEEDAGLLSSRTDSLEKKMETYQEQSKELDARYETLLQKYQEQFSALQSILSSTQQTSNMLTQRFGGEQ